MKRLLLFLFLPVTLLAQVAAPPVALQNWPTSNTTLALGDPAAHTIVGWDDTDNKFVHITIGSNLTYTHSTHTLSASAGGTIPTGTGFYHITTGAADPAAVTETGSGSVVLATGASITDARFFNSANNMNVISGRRFTNTAPTGHLILLNNATDSVALFSVDATGTLDAGTIPEARISFTSSWVPTTRTLTLGAASAVDLSANRTVSIDSFTGVSSNGFLTRTGANTLSAVAAPTGAVVGTTDTQTLSSKRINPRVDSSTAGSATTWAPNADTTDIFELAATLSVAVTTISNPSGTPVEGQKLMLKITSDGSAHALTWSGSQWHASSASGAPALPTTTTASKTLIAGFMWNSTTSKWELLAVQDGY